LVFESVNHEPKRMKEAIANHEFQDKKKEAIDCTLLWMSRQLGTFGLDVS